MTEQEREELVEKMAKAAWESDGTLNWEGVEFGRKIYLREARAALAVAEPVIREQCAEIALRKKKQKYYDPNSIGWEGEWEEVIEFPQEGEKIAAAIREGGNDA